MIFNNELFSLINIFKPIAIFPIPFGKLVKNKPNIAILFSSYCHALELIK